MIAVVETVGIGQHIVTLHFRLVFLELADFSFTCSQSGNISFDGRVVYFYDRSISTSVVGSVVHRECRFEGKMLQEVHFAIDITRCTIVFSFRGVRF